MAAFIPVRERPDISLAESSGKQAFGFSDAISLNVALALNPILIPFDSGAWPA